MNKLRGIILSLLFFTLLCSCTSALEIAVIQNNEAVSGILVEIEGDYETYRYVTNTNRKFFANLTEGYYWITIDARHYEYANEIYLAEDKLNIIDCEIQYVPGFGIGIVALAIIGIIVIKRNQK